MIVSALKGRLRIVDRALMDEHKAQAIESGIQTYAAVRSAGVNRLTGSLLILYDHSAMDARTVCKVTKAQLKLVKAGGILKLLSGKRGRIYVKAGMLASLAGSLVLLAAGSKKWHYRAGAGFIGLLAFHLLSHGNRILK